MCDEHLKLLMWQAYTEEAKKFYPEWQRNPISESLLEDFFPTFKRFAELVGKSDAQ